MQISKSMLLTFLAVIFLWGCSGKEAEKPAPLPFDDPIADEISYIGAPVIFLEKDIQRKVNEKLQGKIAQIKGKPVILKDGKYQLMIDDLTITKVENIALHVRGRDLYSVIPVRIHFEGTFKKRISKKSDKYMKIKTQELDLAVRMRFKTALNVSSNWQLKTTTSFLGYNWIEEPHTKLFFGDLKLTQMADNILTKNKSTIEDAVDKAARTAVDLKKPVSKIWTSLQKPIKLNKKTPIIWIRPVPKTLKIGRIQGYAGYIRLNAEIGLMAETLIGDEPKYAISDKLPPLKVSSNIPSVCDLNVVSRLPYDEINTLLPKVLKGKKIEVAGETIRIKKARISGNGQQLVIQLKIRGDFRGTIYLKGTPRYDLENRAIKIVNLDFDVNSEELLLSAAGWLVETETFRENLQEYLVIPLGEKLDQIPSLVNNALVKSKLSEKVDLGLDSLQIAPQKIAVCPEALEVLVNAKAKVAVQLKKL